MQQQSRAHGGLVTRGGIPASIGPFQNSLARLRLKEELALQQAMSSVSYTSPMVEVFQTPISQLNSLETAANLTTGSMFTQTTAIPSIQQPPLISAERLQHHEQLKANALGSYKDSIVVNLAVSQKEAQLKTAGAGREGTDLEEVIICDR